MLTHSKDSGKMRLRAAYRQKTRLSAKRHFAGFSDIDLPGLGPLRGESMGTVRLALLATECLEWLKVKPHDLHMKNDLVRKLLILSVALALPILGCFSYYTLESAGPLGQIPALATLFAYPLLLISVAGVLSHRFSSKPLGIRFWLFGTGLIISLTILLWVRL